MNCYRSAYLNHSKFVNISIDKKKEVDQEPPVAPVYKLSPHKMQYLHCYSTFTSYTNFSLHVIDELKDTDSR